MFRTLLIAIAIQAACAGKGDEVAVDDGNTAEMLCPLNAGTVRWWWTYMGDTLGEFTAWSNKYGSTTRAQRVKGTANGSLLLDYVEKQDEGTYVCRQLSENDEETVSSVDLIVSGHSNHVVNTSTTMTLTCTFSVGGWTTIVFDHVYPRESVAAYTPGATVPKPTSRRKSRFTVVHNKHNEVTLLVARATAADSGVYNCRAMFPDRYNHTLGKYTVTVAGTSTVQAIVGDNVTLQCITGRPVAQAEWREDGEPYRELTFAIKNTTSRSDASINITATRSATYTCAFDYGGDFTSTVHVIVTNPAHERGRAVGIVVGILLLIVVVALLIRSRATLCIAPAASFKVWFHKKTRSHAPIARDSPDCEDEEYTAVDLAASPK